ITPAIEAMGGTVVAKLQHAINGIKVRATRDQLASMATLPGVVGIKPVLIYKPVNAVSVPFIGTRAVWGGSPAFHGEHIKLAILDTGADYTHASFGGPGTVAAFDDAFANSTKPADPALFGPNAPKVKGGTDLVGDNYDASDPKNNTPVPDDNPLDCNGHGSHVAGTAAGFGVKDDGTTFRGPYDANTPNVKFRIGPGVAPLADVYAAALPSGSLSILVLPDTANTGAEGVSLGCEEKEYDPAKITGKLVVALRGVCARVDRAIFGQRHGAAAVALINNDPTFGVFE